MAGSFTALRQKQLDSLITEAEGGGRTGIRAYPDPPKDTGGMSQAEFSGYGKKPRPKESPDAPKLPKRADNYAAGGRVSRGRGDGAAQRGFTRGKSK